MNRILLFLIALLVTGVTVWSATPEATSAAPSNPPMRFAAPGANPLGITPEEMKELNLARQKALQTNPGLLKSTQELSQKMRDFQHKLNQAILAADPNVAPIVNRMQAASATRLPMPSTGMSPTAIPAAPVSPSH